MPELPREWLGKDSVLAMREAGDRQWKQMEWWAFYFEFLSRRYLEGLFTFPGDRYGNVVFDMKRSANWDLKAKAIKSDDHRTILNDKTAIQRSIEAYGVHGIAIALCDVEYNDVDKKLSTVAHGTQGRTFRIRGKAHSADEHLQVPQDAGNSARSFIPWP